MCDDSSIAAARGHTLGPDCLPCHQDGNGSFCAMRCTTSITERQPPLAGPTLHRVKGDMRLPSDHHVPNGAAWS